MLSKIGSLLRNTARHWSEHKILQLAAALAYYSIFSIAPLLVIVVGLVGWIFGPDAVRGQLEGQLRSTMGLAAAETVQSMVKSAYQPGQGPWATFIGLAALLLGASGVFGQLKDALDTIWNAPTRPGLGVFAFLQDRLVSFGMVLVIGFLMLTSLLLTTVISAGWEFISVYLPLSSFLLGSLGFVVSASLIASLFASIFKWLPEVHVRWREAWVGAAFTAILFEVGKILLGIYLGRESTASGYGAAGAVVLVLLWVYYTTVILLTGACFTRAYRDSLASPSSVLQSLSSTSAA
jgi:membrane protein